MAGVDVGDDYLEVALSLGKLVPGWVEGYVGPAERAEAVDRGDPATPGQLRDRVEALRTKVEDEEEAPDRRAWLLAQLQGISSALLSLSGAQLEYAELFALCHGAHVEHVPVRQFEEAHGLLDRALPGGGEVSARYQAWRKTQLVAKERLGDGLARLGEEMRGRCRVAFDLPDDERVTWELASDVGWAGHADFLGERHTLIRVNADLPISSLRLLELVCHEAYPGHHTENVCKAVSLIQGAGRAELCVYVHPSPQALISEGLASYALEALLGDEAEAIAASCLRAIGIAYDAETAVAIRQAEELLLPVRSNIALMLDGGSTSAEVREYAKTWLLEDASEVDKGIDHLEAGSWRPYESCYPVGHELCRRYSAGSAERFSKLLHEQLTPADLIANAT